MLYSLVTAMYPRFLITFDENLESLPVTVRVGQVQCHMMILFFEHALSLALFTSLQKPTKSIPFINQAVDVVGQAGRPKTITGFQTHSTPVLLAHSERAELATDECKLLIKAKQKKKR